MVFSSRSFLLLFVFIGFSQILLAQPSNDECSGLIDLGTVPICETILYSNLDASPSDIAFNNAPSCFVDNPPQNDVWFSFNTTADADDIKITIESSVSDGIQNIQATVYRGFCIANGLAQLSCASGGVTSLEFGIQDLLPSEQYYIRIDNAGGPSSQGDFTICIEAGLPSFTIADGSSSACEGEIFDSGGASGNYGNNEYFTFEICPDEPFRCLTLELDYYHLEAGDDEVSDFLNIYEGDVSTGNILGTLGGNSSFNYTETNGGICFSRSTASCITLEFSSDNSLNFEGFAGRWFCSNEPCKDEEPIFISTNQDTAAIESILSSDAAIVKVIDIDCPAGAIGVFDTGSESLGIESGLLISTGLAIDAGGINDSRFTSTFHNTEGDADLDSLSILLSGSLQPSLDACAVTVELTANTDQVNFEYIFGSEEYTDFINEGFNDIFALLIDGPDITGLPSLGNKQNLAVLKNTSTPVEIDQINNVTNWQYYRDNALGQPLEYDGFTTDSLGIKKSLTATAQVTPCNTYTLKFAIGDRGDGNFDSGVFISRIEGAKSSISFINDQDNATVFEDCSLSETILSLRIPSEATPAIAYSFLIEGTATIDEDYTITLPSSVMANPSDTLDFPITVISDGIEEDQESVIITLQADYGCGLVNLGEAILIIEDQYQVDIVPDQDSLTICKDIVQTLSVQGLAFYQWSSDLFPADSLQSTINLQTENSGWVYLTASTTDSSGAICSAEDSIYLEAVTPFIDITATGDPSFCRGDSLILTATSNGDPQDITWSPSIGGFSTLIGPETVVSPDFGDFELYYMATTTVGGCEVTDSILINVENIVIPSFDNTDTIICPGDSILLANTPFPWETLYAWTPESSLDNAGSPTPIGFPEVTTTYEVITTSGQGNCIDTSSVTIYVPEANIVSLSQSFIAGESYTFELSSQPMLTIDSINWYVDDMLISMDYPLEWILDGTESILVAEVYYDDQPCAAYDTLTLLFTDEEILVEVPNVFIPGGMIENNRIFRYLILQNGLLSYEEVDYQLLDFRIFNRWGNLVYSCEDNACGEQGWDGTIDGKEAPSAVYLYVMEIELPNKKTVQLKGDVQLLR